MGTARDEAVSQIESYLRRTLLAMDAGEHWVTVNGGSKAGGEGGGSHVMLDGEGRVVAGMGGKFKGTKVDDIPRKKFINEKAYQRRQESAKKTVTSAPKTAQTAQTAPAAPSGSSALSASDMRDRLYKSGLKKWTGGGGQERYYVGKGKDGDAQIKELFGVEVDRYNTGNIRSCKIDGEQISNSKARNIVYSLQNGAYYNAVSGEWKGIPEGVTPKLQGRPDTPTPATSKAPAKEDTSNMSPRKQAIIQQARQFRETLNTPGAFKARLDADKDTMKAASLAVKKQYYSDPIQDGHKYMRVPSPVVQESAKAVAISGRGEPYYTRNGEKQYRDTIWMPKSHVDIKDGQVIGLSNWIAEEKGIAPLGYEYRTSMQGNTARTSKTLTLMSEADADRELVMLGRMRNSGKPNALYNQASSATAKTYFAPFEKEDRESGS